MLVTRSACFKDNLEKTLESELGKELFACLLTIAQQEFGIAKKGHALKNSSVIQRIIDAASCENRVSESLQSIVENIVALKTNSGVIA